MLFFTETCTHFLIKSPFLAENAILEKHKIFWKALSALFSVPSFKLLTFWGQVVRVNIVIDVRFLVDPTQIFLPMNMVATSVLGKLRMRKQNTKTTVPLDVVPERRTKRCSPRFRPGGRFWELRFRYQSSPTGSEGEISRPLDHM